MEKNKAEILEREEMIDSSGGSFKGEGQQIGADDRDITEKDLEHEALKLISDNAKNEKFRDKRTIELDRIKKLAHHTRTKIRVKFPDGYILQGTFGALEKVSDVLEFVKENLATKDRQFYLFETPPKRKLNKPANSLQ